MKGDKCYYCKKVCTGTDELHRTVKIRGKLLKQKVCYEHWLLYHVDKSHSRPRHSMHWRSMPWR